MKEILEDENLREEDLREEEDKDSDSIDSIADKIKKGKNFQRKNTIVDRDKEKAKNKILRREERSNY